MAKARKKASSKLQRRRKMKLIISPSKRPEVKLKKGARLKVVAVSLVSPTLKRPKAIAARLCGGTNTCLAMVEL